MKPIFFIHTTALIFALSFISCTEHLENEIKSLTQSKDSLAMILQERDNIITQNQALLEKIENALTSISEKERTIEVESPNNEAKKHILSEINSLHEKILEYKKKYQSNLNYISSLKGDIGRLQEKVDSQKTDIDAKDASIESLKSENGMLRKNITQKDASIDSLNQVIARKESILGQNEIEARKVFYVIGTKKDLIAKGILDKKGNQMVGKPDVKYFSQIDYNKTTSIPIMAKTASMITPHAKDSYEYFSSTLERTDSLYIVKPQEFWSISKYMVIVIK